VEDYLTGVRYAFGNGVPQDYAKAAEYFMRSALQGQADAQYNLGILYDKGLGVSKDPVRAAIWYHSAAEQGHASAQLNLGLAYASGSGVEQNFGEAVRWFRRAAEQGNVTAQYNLAALYANGKGVEASDSYAYAWFSIAAAAGDQEAREQMEASAKRLNPQQMREARALAPQIVESLKRGGTSTGNAAGAPARPPANASPQAGDPPAPPKPADKATVAEIQRYLIKLHYDPGTADGVGGDKTTEAIRQYQIDRRIKVDGEPSKNLLYRLKAEVEKQKK
jgi:TPR repeat protein